VTDTQCQYPVFGDNVPQICRSETDESNSWREADATEFKVRSADYIITRRKEFSEPQLCPLVDVEIFQTAGKRGDRFDNFAEHPLSYIQKRLRAGDNRFFVNLHFQSPRYHTVLTWVVPSDLEPDTPFYKLWNEFLNGSDKFRNEHFKIIPRIVEGNWFVRNSCGNKPCLLANALVHSWNKTDSYLEIECDTMSSRLAASLCDLCINYSSNLIIELAFMVEGRTPDRLPERIFGTVRLVRPELPSCHSYLQYPVDDPCSCPAPDEVCNEEFYDADDPLAPIINICRTQ